jgi:CDP-diacylglycerol--inositol 3-phosphatidyltransferase
MFFTASLKQHHKSAEGNLKSFALVRWYYSYYYFFGYCCVGTEFTYVAVYILARLNSLNQYDKIRIGCKYFLMISTPACITKQIVNVSQLCSACHAVAADDAAQKNK